MNCAECQDLLLDLAYGELDPVRAAEVTAHAAGCANCGPALARLQGTRALVVPLAAPEEPGAGFDGKILDAARAEAAKVAPAAASGGGTVSSLDEARLRRRSRWMRAAVGVSIAAAASLAVVVSNKVTKREPQEEVYPRVVTGQAAAEPGRPDQAAPEKSQRAEQDKTAQPAQPAQPAAEHEQRRASASDERPRAAPQAPAPAGPPANAVLRAQLEPRLGEKKAAKEGRERAADGLASLDDALGAGEPGPGGTSKDSKRRVGDLAGGLSGVGGAARGAGAGSAGGSLGVVGAGTQAIAKLSQPGRSPARSAGPKVEEKSGAGDAPAVGADGPTYPGSSFSSGAAAAAEMPSAAAPPPPPPRAKAVAAAPPALARSDEAAKHPQPKSAAPAEDADGLERQAAATADHAISASLWRRAAALRRNSNDVVGAARDLARAVDQLAAAGLVDEAQAVQTELAALTPSQSAAVAEGQRAVDRARRTQRKGAKPADQAPASQQVEF